MRITASLLFAVLLIAAVACGPAGTSGTDESSVSLKTAFADAFLVGAALGDRQVTGSDSVATFVPTEFNSVTPENVMKWESIHPAPDSFAFEAADRYVAYGEEHGMFIVGHTLVWHSQTPRWVFEHEDGTPLDREALIARMTDHITAVVSRYAGRVDGWDVVNEALNEDGTLRDTPWRRIIGDDYLRIAFEAAHAADPDAQLYYNDYSLANLAKAEGAIRIVNDLQTAGMAVHGVGMQGHYKMDWPSPALFDSAIVAITSTGLPVHVTEFDIDVLPQGRIDVTADVDRREEMLAALNPYADGLPDSMHSALAGRYAELFDVLVRRADVVERVTFWGTHDGSSWLNNWPVRGRTAYPLLFDRSGARKPAYDAVVATAAR